MHLGGPKAADVSLREAQAEAHRGAKDGQALKKSVNADWGFRRAGAAGGARAEAGVRTAHDRSRIFLSAAYFSKAKIRFQSFFMRITTQPCFIASSYSAWLKVPTFVSGNPSAGPY